MTHLYGKRSEKPSFFKEKWYICRQEVGNPMSTSHPTPNKTHPLVAFHEEIEKRGVLMIEDVKEIPSNDIPDLPFVSPHLVIGLCHQGYSIGEYDTKPIRFGIHDFSVVYPNHPIMAKETSEDYRSTLIIISSSFHNELRPRLIYGGSLLFHSLPRFHLSEEHYHCVSDTLKLLKSVINLDSPSRKGLTIGILDILTKLIDIFRQTDDDAAPQQPATEAVGGSLLFKRFYDLLALHHKESREVQYYARLLCLSPKYFGSLIKKEMGISAGQCIANYITIQAKTLLHYRPDLSIQQISQHLGFDDSTSFSRYFTSAAGISPKKYREQQHT